MIDTPELLATQPLVCAKIYQIVPSSDIQSVMGKTLQELKAGIQEQGITITGPWFTHHINPPGKNFDFEVCFPVSSPVEPKGRMQPGEWPAMNLVRTVYKGGYEGLGAAWAEFTAWIKANGYATEPEIWERYIAGPETGNDSSKWQTELNLRLADK